MKVLSLSILLFSSYLRAQTCHQVLPDKVESLVSTAQKLLPKLQAEAAQKDMAGFCQRNFLVRYLNSTDKAPSNCENLDTKKLEKLAEDSVSQEHPDSWNFSLIPTESLSKKALSRSLIDLRHLQDYSGNDDELINQAKDVIEKNIAIYPGDLFSLKTNINELKTEDLDGDRITVAQNAQTALLCAELSFTMTPSCVSGVDTIRKINAPKTSTTVSGAKYVNPDLWLKVMTTSEYDEGLRLAALKVMKHVEGNMSPKDNIFDDIKSSFQEAGMNPSKAVDAAFDILGFLSNGGANTGKRTSMLFPAKSTRDTKSYSLTLMASALSMLDYKKSKKGQPLYSYPSQVQTKCLYPKSYHFWMSAYLSRKLMKEQNLSPKAAAAAVFTSEKGYQILRDVGRPIDTSTTAGLLSRPAFDPAHQIVRTDLAFAAAGAFFGVEGSNKSVGPIDIDGSIADLLSSSKVVPPPNKDEMKKKTDVEKYVLWKDIFNPNAAFNHFYP